MFYVSRRNLLFISTQQTVYRLKVKDDQHKQEHKKEKQLNQNNRQYEYL